MTSAHHQAKAELEERFKNLPKMIFAKIMYFAAGEIPVQDGDPVLEASVSEMELVSKTYGGDTGESKYIGVYKLISVERVSLEIKRG